MYTNKRLIVICDMTSTIDKETGDRKQEVADAKLVIGNKDFVGITTQQLAQSQNMTFQYTIEIDRMFYNKQKYLYLENDVYEIKNLAKGNKPHLCKLSVVFNDDKDVKNAIERWLNDLQQ